MDHEVVPRLIHVITSKNRIMAHFHGPRKEIIVLDIETIWRQNPRNMEFFVGWVSRQHGRVSPGKPSHMGNHGVGIWIPTYRNINIYVNIIYVYIFIYIYDHIWPSCVGNHLPAPWSMASHLGMAQRSAEISSARRTLAEDSTRGVQIHLLRAHIWRLYWGPNR